MKVLLAIAIMVLPGAAMAGSTCQVIGNQTFCTGDNGGSVTGQRIGDFDFYNGTTRDPNTGQTRTFNQTCQWVGNMRVCN
jgi:hypothetical protein